MGTKFNDSCLQKAADNEPIFVLRAQDMSSPKVILHWIAKNFENISDERALEAFNQALTMRKWPKRKTAD